MKKVKTEEASDDRRVLEDAISLFKKSFPSSKPQVATKAHGRVNLIGEHTDYNDGYCFPMTIPLFTVCVIGYNEEKEDQDVCQLVSMQDEKRLKFKQHDNCQDWGTYVAGALHFTRQGADDKRRNVVCSFNSTVPLGGGLSSSAALEVSFAAALEILDGGKLGDGKERALRCVEGDHQFAHVPCGVMDQMCVSSSKAGFALLLDCATNEIEYVHLHQARFLVVDTKVKHSHSTGAYKKRVSECQEACLALNVRKLREVTDVKEVEKIADETVRKRARHIVSETLRCVKAKEAATNLQWGAFGSLMFSSHQSLRDDYEVSCEELDFVVEVCKGEAEAGGVCIGARMTGGGFGGCAVLLLQPGATEKDVEAFEAKLKERYKAKFGFECLCYLFDKIHESPVQLTINY